ncbi:MAG: hypothetical protein ACLQO6_07355 [Desulfomonilaceae bacterium]
MLKKVPISSNLEDDEIISNCFSSLSGRLNERRLVLDEILAVGEVHVLEAGAAGDLQHARPGISRTSPN